MTLNLALLIAIIAVIIWAVTSWNGKTPKLTQVAWFVFQAALLAYMIDVVAHYNKHIF